MADSSHESWHTTKKLGNMLLGSLKSSMFPCSLTHLLCVCVFARVLLLLVVLELGHLHRLDLVACLVLFGARFPLRLFLLGELSLPLEMVLAPHVVVKGVLSAPLLIVLSLLVAWQNILIRWTSVLFL